MYGNFLPMWSILETLWPETFWAETFWADTKWTYIPPIKWIGITGKYECFTIVFQWSWVKGLYIKEKKYNRRICTGCWAERLSTVYISTEFTRYCYQAKYSLTLLVFNVYISSNKSYLRGSKIHILSPVHLHTYSDQF